MRTLSIALLAGLCVAFVGPAAAQELPAPRLLDANESPATSSPGSFPTATEPLGHEHPSCETDYGLTPSQIESTPCSLQNADIPGGTTISACAYNGIADFRGDDIKFDCVYWLNRSANAQFTTRCYDSEGGGCENIEMDRVTFIGNGEAPMKCIEVSNRGSEATRSFRMTRSDIQGCEDIFFENSASCAHPFPGEGDRALVLRGNRIHGADQPSGGHVGILSMHGSSCTLIENNRVDGSDATPGSNVSATLSSSNGSDVIYRNNHFLSDDNGRMFRFDTNNPGDEWTCDDPVQFDGNVITYTADSYFGFGGSTRACPNIENRRAPSSCDGNTTLGSTGFADGSTIRCSGDGR